MLLRASLLDAPTPDALRFVADGALLLDGERIVDAGWAEDLLSRHASTPLRDLRPCWILPGLMDLHAHLPQLGSVALEGLPLLEWLERHIFPAEAAFADPAFAADVSRAFFRDCLQEGTTTVVAYGSSHATAAEAALREAEACGIRAVLGPALMDRHAPENLCVPPDRILGPLEDLLRTWQGRHGRLEVAVAPRFAPSCTAALMTGAAHLADRYGAVVETHLSESKAEIAWVAELFPEAPHYAGVYEAMGLLGPRTLLGHGIHLEPAERELLRATGATVVHCPRSNGFLQSGIMPLRAWRDEGLSLALGTDVGAGPSLSLFAEMGFAAQAARLREEPVDSACLFHLATAGGAKALGWNHLGTLDPGRDADFLVVDPAAADPLGRSLEDPGRVLSQLIHRSSAAMVRETWVQGRRCR